MIRNSRSSLITQNVSNSTSTVNTTLTGVDNKLARIQPIGPVMRTGGACGDRCWSRTKCSLVMASSPSAMVMAAPSPFHQRHAPVVKVHQARRDEADRQVDGHRDGDDLDRLAGLVEHGTGERRR